MRNRRKVKVNVAHLAVKPTSFIKPPQLPKSDAHSPSKIYKYTYFVSVAIYHACITWLELALISHSEHCPKTHPTILYMMTSGSLICKLQISLAIINYHQATINHFFDESNRSMIVSKMFTPVLFCTTAMFLNRQLIFDEVLPHQLVPLKIGITFFSMLFSRPYIFSALKLATQLSNILRPSSLNFFVESQLVFFLLVGIYSLTGNNNNLHFSLPKPYQAKEPLINNVVEPIFALMIVSRIFFEMTLLIVSVINQLNRKPTPIKNIPAYLLNSLLIRGVQTSYIMMSMLFSYTVSKDIYLAASTGITSYFSLKSVNVFNNRKQDQPHLLNPIFGF